MNKLVGPKVNVVLSVNQGRGFDFLQNPVFVRAVLNGLSLDTNRVSPSYEPQFDTDLLWEINKKEVRRLRSGGGSLKVSCCRVLNKFVYETVAYLVLHLREAVVVPKGETIIVKDKWRKLFTETKETIRVKPELLLSLKIEDGENHINIKSQCNILNPNTCEPLDHPLKYYREDIIQIGPENKDCNIFSLTILLQEVHNLHLLFHNNISMKLMENKALFFSYHILGHIIQSNPLQLSESLTLPKTEKATMHIRSSLMLLRQFFNGISVFPLKLILGQQDIGVTDVDLKSLIQTDDVSTFGNESPGKDCVTTYRSCCYLECCKTHQVPSGLNGEMPCVIVTLQLHMIRANIEQLDGDGEVSTGDTEFETAEKITLQEIESRNKEYGAGDGSLQQDTVKMPLLVLPPQPLNINTGSVTMLPIILPESHQVSPSRSKTHLPVSKEMLPMDDMADDDLVDELYVRPQNCSESVLDTATYSEAIQVVSPRDNLKEATGKCTLILENPQLSDKVGVLTAALSLKDSVPSQTSIGLTEDEIATKIVEELEDWKQTQQEIFEANLKNQEELKMASLTTEFEKQYLEMEEQLNCKDDECTYLSEKIASLSEAIQLKSDLVSEMEAEKEEMKLMYQNGVQDLKESFKQLEDIYINKLAEKDIEMLENVEKVKNLENGNAILCSSLEDLQTNDDNQLLSSLTQDQATSLIQEMKCLEEKLGFALKSKSFFKEEWARAVREIHRLKVEHQQATRVYIQSSKDELKNLGFNDLLDEEESDRAILQQLRSSIKILGFKGEDDHQIFTPTYPLNLAQAYVTEPTHRQEIGADIGFQEMDAASAVSQPSMEQRDGVEARIKTLIDERDVLLRTGNYNVDDTIIFKLNQEIRKLIVHSNGLT